MKTLLIFLIFLVSLELSHSCCNSCNTNCCSSCCSTCRNQCTTVTCINICHKTCCECKPTTVAPTTTTETITSQLPTRETEPTTPTSATTTRTTTKRVTFKHEINVNSVNFLNNQNSINIRIGVVRNNTNTITNRGGGSGSTVSFRPLTPTTPTTTSTTPSTTTPWVIQTPPPVVCCTIIVPCITYGCNPYQYRCHGCQGHFGYWPRNPCHGGCRKRPTWDTQKCYFGHCYSHRVDCSLCHDNFYQTYEGYSRCHGCFYQ